MSHFKKLKTRVKMLVEVVARLEKEVEESRSWPFFDVFVSFSFPTKIAPGVELFDARSRRPHHDEFTEARRRVVKQKVHKVHDELAMVLVRISDREEA